jgi:ankyrin repeat protein
MCSLAGLVVCGGESQGGTTALMYAAADDHSDCLRLLIDAGADIDVRSIVRVGRCFAGATSFFSGDCCNFSRALLFLRLTYRA